MFDPNRLLPTELEKVYQRESRGFATERSHGHQPRWPEHAVRRNRPARWNISSR